MITRRSSRTLVLLVAVVLLTLTTKASGASTTQDTPSIYDCNQLVHRPSTLTLTCADANRYLQHITWISWTQAQARANGELTWNDCTPSCVNGHWHTKEISFIARDPRTVDGTRLFTQLYGPTAAWGVSGRVWSLPTSPE